MAANVGCSLLDAPERVNHLVVNFEDAGAAALSLVILYFAARRAPNGCTKGKALGLQAFLSRLISLSGRTRDGRARDQSDVQSPTICELVECRSN